MEPGVTDNVPETKPPAPPGSELLPPPPPAPRNVTFTDVTPVGTTNV